MALHLKKLYDDSTSGYIEKLKKTTCIRVNPRLSAAINLFYFSFFFCIR